MPLKVTVERKPGGNYVVVRPEGAIDATTYSTLAIEIDAVLQMLPSLVIFDLERVDYVSSAGIGVVLSTEKAMQKMGGKTALVNLKPHIQKVFTIVQAVPVKQLFNNVRDLDAYLAEMQRQEREKQP
jgi:anti-sigma B factor antagonist